MKEMMLRNIKEAVVPTLAGNAAGCWRQVLLLLLLSATLAACGDDDSSDESNERELSPQCAVNFGALTLGQGIQAGYLFYKPSGPGRWESRSDLVMSNYGFELSQTLSCNSGYDFLFVRANSAVYQCALVSDFQLTQREQDLAAPSASSYAQQNCPAALPLQLPELAGQNSCQVNFGRFSNARSGAASYLFYKPNNENEWQDRADLVEANYGVNITYELACNSVYDFLLVRASDFRAPVCALVEDIEITAAHRDAAALFPRGSADLSYSAEVCPRDLPSVVGASPPRCASRPVEVLCDAAEIPSVPSSAAVAGKIAAPGKLDWYNFTITAPSTQYLVINVSSATEIFSTLYNSSFDLLAVSAGVFANNSDITIALAPGSYYLKLEGFAGAMGSYELHLVAAGCDNRPLPASCPAEEIGSFPYSNSSAALATAGGIDWYSFTLASMQNILANVSWRGPADASSAFVLYDSYFYRIFGGGRGVTGDEAVISVIDAALLPGTYYLKVTGGSAESGPYSLNASAGSDCINLPGDGCSSVGIASIPYTGRRELSSTQEVHWFRLVSRSVQDLVINTTGSTNTFGALFEGVRSSLYEDDGAFFYLAEDDDSGAGNNFSINATIYPGDYYLRVTGYDQFGDRPPATGNYTLNINPR